jgi:hypothetical protein
VFICVYGEIFGTGRRAAESEANRDQYSDLPERKTEESKGEKKGKKKQRKEGEVEQELVAGKLLACLYIYAL